MALQHVRSLLWRGEDLGFGGGNTRELISPTSVAAGGRPSLATQGFVGSTSLPIGSSVTLALSGKNRLLVNRSTRYWLTVSGMAATANGGGAGAYVSFPIAPLQMFFVPQNFVGPATIAANSAWPIPQPLSGSPGTTVPLAQTTNTLTFDWVTEA